MAKSAAGQPLNLLLTQSELVAVIRIFEIRTGEVLTASIDDFRGRSGHGKECLIAMFTKTVNDVVRLAFASTPRELLDALAPLPHGVRYGVACDPEYGGTAHRYDNPSARAYYLSFHDRGFLVWRWNYVPSYEEAGRLLAMVNSLGSELNGKIASRIFFRPTRRPIALPVPELDPRPIPNTTRIGFA